MVTQQQIEEDPYTALHRLLAPEDAAQLARALEALDYLSGGWGHVDLSMKAGKIDTAEPHPTYKRKKAIAK